MQRRGSWIARRDASARGYLIPLGEQYCESDLLWRFHDANVEAGAAAGKTGAGWPYGRCGHRLNGSQNATANANAEPWPIR